MRSLALAACLLTLAGGAWAQDARQTAAGPNGVVTPRPAQAAPTLELPILGWAQITLRVSDLEKSRHYYRDVLGFPEAFALRDEAGTLTSVFFKVNDDQFIEIVPGLRPGELLREVRLVAQASDLAKLHAIYDARGLNPGPITRGPDGNPVFRTLFPSGVPLDFIQYAPDSKQTQLRGKLLSPDRISTHIWHFGTLVKGDDTNAFFEKLGWSRLLPGVRGDYIEPQQVDRNRETKNPPLEPDHPQYMREVYGAVYHLSLEVTDIHAARETLKRRGGFDDLRLRTAVGNNRRWLIHVFDPDGTRAELMSSAFVPDAIPSFSVMPPGPPAPPILATTPGVYPWP